VLVYEQDMCVRPTVWWERESFARLRIRVTFRSPVAARRQRNLLP